MAETIGSLCDKLTIVKLKQWHTQDACKLESLSKQEEQLKAEINEYIYDAINGKIPLDRLTFEANKVYNAASYEVREISGNFGEVFSALAEINCKLWHEQEKVYEFEKVPVSEKDRVVKQLAVLNLERNQCIDKLNSYFYSLVAQLQCNVRR
jgi:hypothetical protein